VTRITKIGDDSELGDEELKARTAGEAVGRPQWSGTGLAGAADERLCLPDSAGGREGEQGSEMGQRGRAQDAPEAAQGEADQAHRRDGVDVRLAGHNSRLQQVIDEVAAGSGSPKLPSCQRSRARIRTRACPQFQHLAPIDPNSENFLLRVKPLGDLTKKTKKKGIEDIPSELPKRRRYR
jgi:hypothetical protein